MTRITFACLWVFVGLGGSGAVTFAQRAAQEPKPAETVGANLLIVTPREIKWTDSPAGVARGTPSVAPGAPLHYAAIQGDPLKPGVPQGSGLNPTRYQIRPLNF